MKKFSSPSQRIGELGEDIAVRYLLNKGFEIVERNYTKKWGEIDVVAQLSGVLHFVEVKSTYLESIQSVSREKNGVLGNQGVNPIEHVDFRKRERLSRTIETYLMGKRVLEWQFDVICVYLDENSKQAKVEVFKDIIL